LGSIISSPSTLDGVEWSTPRPGRFYSRGRDPIPLVQEAGWAPGAMQCALLYIMYPSEKKRQCSKMAAADGTAQAQNLTTTEIRELVWCCECSYDISYLKFRSQIGFFYSQTFGPVHTRPQL